MICECLRSAHASTEVRARGTTSSRALAKAYFRYLLCLVSHGRAFFSQICAHNCLASLYTPMINHCRSSNNALDVRAQITCAVCRSSPSILIVRTGQVAQAHRQTDVQWQACRLSEAKRIPYLRMFVRRPSNMPSHPQHSLMTLSTGLMQESVLCA